MKQPVSRSPSDPSGHCLPIAFALVCFLCALASGCRSPIGAKVASPVETYRQVHANALSDNEVGSDTRSLLRRYDEATGFKVAPDEALRRLHRRAAENRDRDLLFGLAELSYFRGQQLRTAPASEPSRDPRAHYLAAAVYAYFYLFGDASTPPPSPFDRRFRTACDLYNYGLGGALLEPGRTNALLRLAVGLRPLPVGRIDLTFPSAADSPGDWSVYDQFLMADRFVTRGLTVRNRQPGLGTPILGIGHSEHGLSISDIVPATVFLRVDGDYADLESGGCRGTLELHSAYGETSVVVGDHRVPLETDTTIRLAYALNDQFAWRIGRLQFLSGEERVPSDVYLSQPYEPGRVPVVFVHGTFSSPVKWAEMANTLQADPVLRRRCQFWYFIYNSGNPVTYSALRLREALEARRGELDADGKDPALDQMVVIGHSQGGLLTKLTATDTGDRLWRASATNRLEDLDLTDSQRSLVRRYTEFEALPFVKRVVFIATPHRGSYRANNLAQKLARWIVKMPNALLKVHRELAPVAGKVDLPPQLKGQTPTSIDSMSPKAPWLLALADTPLAPHVEGHSIVAVAGNDHPPEGKDGLVAYSSAHVDYVQSEFIVRGKHSCISLPATIEEVRRILHRHLEFWADPAAGDDPAGIVPGLGRPLRSEKLEFHPMPARKQNRAPLREETAGWMP